MFDVKKMSVKELELTADTLDQEVRDLIKKSQDLHFGEIQHPDRKVKAEACEAMADKIEAESDSIKHEIFSRI